MDEERDHKLPNLKICIENTESDEDKRDPVPISEDEELDYIEEIDSNASSAEDNVEFNVRLGNLQKSGSGDSRPDSKLLKTRDDSRLIKHKSESEEGEISDSSDETPVEFNVRLGKLSTHSSANKVPNRYRSQEDGLLGKNSHLKSDKARRLGMEISKRDPSIDLQELYRSLGLEENRIDEDRRGIRLEAIHFRGLKDMNTKDVFEYYREFNPGNVEWIDDQSCNVVWQDPLYTARALLRLSKSYNQVMLGDSRAEETSDTEKDKTKEPRRKKLVKKQRKNNSSSSASSSSSSSEDEEDSSMKKKGRKKLPPNQKCQDSLSSKLSVPGKEDPVPEKMEEDDDDVLDLMDEGDKREKGNKDMDVTEKNKKSDESSKKKKLSARDTKASASKERQSRKDQRSSRGQSNKARVSSSSSSSSSSGSSHGSSSSSSASSSSSSSSGSSSDSSSSSSSSSNEGKKETGLKVKTVKTVKKTKKPKPVAVAPAGRKPADIPWPPGKWRLGKPYKNSKYLFLRYAIKSDRKSSSTDKLGMMFQKNRHSSNREDRGLISKSRKESFQARQQQDQAGEAQRALSAKRSTIKYDDVEDIFGDDTVNVSMEMDEIEEFGAKPQSKKEIEERLKSILGENKPKQREPESEEEVMPPKEESDDDLDLTMDTKVPEVDEEAALMEQELDILLAEPPKKRTMRMYADDVEEERVSKRLHKRLETDDSPEYHDDPSLEPRRRKDARARISGKSVTMAIPSGGTDLRNKLKASRRTPYDKSSSYNRYQRVRVEVRD